MKGKAQVTIYIILGFIVLIGAGVVFFLQSEEVESVIQTEIPGEAQYAGQQELRNFMDACMSEAAFNGIEIIRLQGGYIDIPSDTPSVLVKNEENEQIIVDGGIKKVVVDPNGEGNSVAYWLDSNNRLFIPSQGYIEDNLADYVEQSVLACVDEFNSFKSQGYEVSVGQINAEAEFSDEILLRVDYPITFEKDDVRFEEKEFILRVPINIKKAIDLQIDLVLGEYMGSYLESNIKYLISLYSYGGGDKDEYDLPPLTFADPSLDCKMVTWNLDEAKQKVFDNLRANAKYFQIKGAGDEEVRAKSEVESGVYKGLTSDILAEPYEDIKVDFEVNEDGLFFDVKPRSGNTIRPNRHTATGINFLPLFCNVRYQFKYTLKFPMMSKVSVLDSPAININSKTLDNDNDFVFSIPMGVFLCGNQNRECTGKPAYVDEEYDIDYEALGITEPVQTMFCDADQKLSQLMKIRTIDAYTFGTVSDVAVFYKCGSYENDCLIAVSDTEGDVESNFPLCENGDLYAIKKDYSESVQLLSTYEGDELRQFDYLIEPLKELDVEIKFVDLDALMGNYYLSQGFTSNRCTGESVAVNDATLAVKPVIDENIIISSNYGPGQVGVVYPESKKVKLASGDYSLSYLAEGEVVVQPVTYNGQTIGINKDGSAYAGTYLLGSYNDFRVSFDLSVLKAAEKIIFYVPLEITSKSFSVADAGANVVQADGSLYKEGLIDDDCDPATEDKEVEIRITKEEFESLLRPRLE